MAEAKRPKDNPKWAQKVQAVQEIRSLRALTFEDLTGQEKDKLLKLVALRLGLISPSEE